MKYILTLAFKNILRAKRRTILTFLMLSFGVALYILMSSFFAGFDSVSFDNVVNFETGHVKIRPASYDKETPYSLDNLIEDPAAIEEKLKEKKYITGYTQRVKFFGEIDNGIDSQPVVIVGVDQERDKSVFSLEKFYSEGRLEAEGAVVGADLARDLGLGMGDPFFITFRDREGMYTSIETYISGVLYSPDPMSNKGKVFLALDFTKEWLGITAASEITIKTDDLDDAIDYAEELQAIFPEAQVKSWKDISYQFADITAQKKSASQVILFFILIIAMVGIINTILISVYEKRREIGTLKAMGMLDKDVRNLFVAEGFFIGLLGSISGILLGTLFVLPLATIGIDLSSIVSEMGDAVGMAMVGVIYPGFALKDYVMAVSLSTIVSVLASYFPARRVMLMQPVECLRTVQ